MSKIIVGYWDIRGFANPIRCLLTYAGEDFEDKLYNQFDDTGTFWFENKFKMGFDLPGLPYLIDGDTKITQSQAILRYLGRKYKLCASTEKEQVMEEMLQGAISDLLIDWVFNICYARETPTFTFHVTPDTVYDVRKNIPAFKERLVQRLEQFEVNLGKKQWLLGDKITHIDFAFYEALDFHRIMFPKCLDQYSNLKQFLDRFEAIPSIKNYMKSKSYIRAPLVGRRATVGGSDEIETFE